MLKLLIGFEFLAIAKALRGGFTSRMDGTDPGRKKIDFQIYVLETFLKIGSLVF